MYWAIFALIVAIVFLCGIMIGVAIGEDHHE